MIILSVLEIKEVLAGLGCITKGIEVYLESKCVCMMSYMYFTSSRMKKFVKEPVLIELHPYGSSKDSK